MRKIFDRFCEVRFPSWIAPSHMVFAPVYSLRSMFGPGHLCWFRGICSSFLHVRSSLPPQVGTLVVQVTRAIGPSVEQCGAPWRTKNEDTALVPTNYEDHTLGATSLKMLQVFRSAAERFLVGPLGKPVPSNVTSLHWVYVSTLTCDIQCVNRFQVQANPACCCRRLY